jgi:hypothetical protein
MTILSITVFRPSVLMITDQMTHWKADRRSESASKIKRLGWAPREEKIRCQVHTFGSYARLTSA